jgi:hypothetical protein
MAVGTCQSQNKEENFHNFFENFKEDSIYRNERIILPIKGSNSDLFNPLSMTDSSIIFLWENPKELKYYLKYVFSEFKTNPSSFKLCKSISENIYKVEISKKASGFFTVFDFKKKNKKWYLVYFLYHDL